ncbi:MAG: RnfABCDGE type electron transport complex subunit D [Sedimentisphaerales bacterium]|nr:RnfABCDGE type electron transport complex subunit D [Sedimentisphaerales bacterium]
MLTDITVSFAPHISKKHSTRSVMLDVIIGLAPAMIAAVIFFRLYAITLVATCVISCMATEGICNLIRKKPNTLDDLSAVITGIILAFSIPPAFPLWAAIVGSVFSIAIGKMVFGGLGANIFNPAMVGRAFLTASFGMMMATWTVPGTIDPNMPQIAASENAVDVRTQASPLAYSKNAQKAQYGARELNESVGDIFLGNVGGCLGETSALALLIGGIYLLIRKTISFHIPVAVLLSTFIFSGIAYLINSDYYASPLYHLSSGGLFIGAFFIATDPVTAPLTRRGMWLFGFGVGTITMLVRIFGSFPEGMMYSILLMNAVTPLIDRMFKRVPAGGLPSAR